MSLLRDQYRTVLSSDGGLTVRPPGVSSGSPYVQPDVTTVLDVRPNAGGLLLAGAIQAGRAIVVAPVDPRYPLSIDGTIYRGAAIVDTASDGSLDVINVVDLERYLSSVVGSEMDPSWPQAALQAQAIVARTYAVAHLGTREWLGYDLRAGEQDQAYKGVEAETPSVVAAVSATRGKILVAGADVVHAYYSDCDGGYTSSGDALDDPQPYLVAQHDPYCETSPDDTWNASVDASSFASALRGRYGDIGAVVSAAVGARDESGRALSIAVTGTKDSRVIPATAFRMLAGAHVVRSTRIDSISVSNGVIRVAGEGFGHGVGMAQWGARGMAEAGKSADEILKFYYRGAQFASIADRLATR
ncbi:MAG TPA: SpoIID/LytB domain-containing protein [Candidatus Eremiobacteraceae bacterium]|nr:SpoIID/LytB domain-containing protein [Candidatus Eremiobacteraceae bacterium]